MRKMTAFSASLQPNSAVGPILRFGWTPTQAPVSSRARHVGAMPQCQKVIVLSFSSTATGSPKKAALPVISCPAYMESAP